MSTYFKFMVDNTDVIIYNVCIATIGGAILIKEKVLYILEQQKESVVTGGQLASELGVSRNAVWKAVNTLKNEGNEIVSIPNSGYKLLNTNDTLSEIIIKEQLKTAFIGQRIELLSSVNSTNQYIKEMDIMDVPSGFVVTANEQMSGRGRRGRTFLSNKSEGVYLSILLKIDGIQNDIRLLTICAAVAVSKALEMACGIKADIKWVNDIFCGGKKMCGILTEAVISGELQELSTVIIGIGINTGEIASEISDIATSVFEQTGVRGIRNLLIAEVLNQFEAVYNDFLEEKQNEIIEDYRKRLFIVGKRVTVTGMGENFLANVVGVDDMGALIVKNERGDDMHITSGEIIVDWGNKK